MSSGQPGSKKVYDQYKCPPDIGIAETHLVSSCLRLVGNKGRQKGKVQKPQQYGTGTNNRKIVSLLRSRPRGHTFKPVL